MITVMDAMVEDHMEEIFNKLSNSDRVLTKESVSGSEFGDPLYKLWRIRNPDTSLVKSGHGDNHVWYSKLMNTLNNIRGTAMHLLIEHTEGLSGNPEVELSVEHEGMTFTGTCDRELVVDDEFCVIDYKNSMSAVINKVHGLVETGNTKDKYLDAYRYQISLYTYLLWKTKHSDKKMPEYGYICYMPSSMYAKHSHTIPSGKFWYTLKVDLLTVDEIENRMKDIKNAMTNQPDFDCNTDKHCVYCTAKCELGKKYMKQLDTY